MRIGILTLPLHTNYGGILQAYALQTVLEKMGHQVVVFDTPNKTFLPPLWKMPLSFGKRTLKKILGRTDRIFIEHFQNKIRPIMAKNIQPFIDGKIHRKVIKNFSQLSQSDYDAIIVGSDQVWRSVYFHMWLGQGVENGYLLFAKDWKIKRISYAASFGTSNWEYTDEQTQMCRLLLKKFDAVSVRESNGVELCKKYFDIDALQVLDPTMLISTKEYCNIFREANTPKSKGTLLNYVLDENEEICNLIKEFSIKKKLIPFALNNSFENDDTKPLEMRIKSSVETWLRGFYDAEFVITDSFHACVFSILFKKQFIVVGNRKRGMARFESLLNLFGLEDRLVSADVNVIDLPIINYDLVYDKLNVLKKISLSFLERALNEELCKNINNE